MSLNEILGLDYLMDLDYLTDFRASRHGFENLLANPAHFEESNPAHFEESTRLRPSE
jgi:hypothetical protein